MVISTFEGTILARLLANFTSSSPATDFTLLPKRKSFFGLNEISLLYFTKQPPPPQFSDKTLRVLLK